ncbi:MAG TPA: DUF3179 domain-containing (seleno)protein [Isosphaeraceae bacterium]|jgi:hypothetical protein
MTPFDSPSSSSLPEPSAPIPAARGRRRGMVYRGVSLAVLAVLLGFIAREAPVLWREWQELQGDRQRERASTLIGYEGIFPNVQYADRPPDWIHDEGDTTLLWAGWQPGVGHRWFRLGRGQLDLERIAGPLGRDTVRAIDVPVVEVGGGPRWQRIPYDARVAALDLEGVSSAYPLRVLEKVEMVNDQIRGRPFLVTFSPFVPESVAFNVYETVLDGRRLTLGSSGYFLGRRPLWYDRGTESLWIERTEGLAAVAGPRAGTVLRRLRQPILVSWDDWRSEHPEGRLIVGADRSRGLPAD